MWVPIYARVKMSNCYVFLDLPHRTEIWRGRSDQNVDVIGTMKAYIFEQTLRNSYKLF